MLRTAAVSCLFVAIASAQVTQPARPAFEVASIKLHQGMLTMSGVSPSPGGKLSAVATTLKGLVAAAYGVKQREIVGGPAWIEADRYEVEAKADAPTASASDLLLMLQSLLADRFQLKVHTESREMPAYELRVAKSGSKMSPASSDCTPKLGDPCGGFMTRMGLMQAQQADMKQLADSLSQIMDRPVVDKTGLTGPFQNVKLQWTPDENQFRDWGGAPPDALGPSLFTALQEKLGLQLQSVRTTVNVVVIDQAQKPTPN